MTKVRIALIAGKMVGGGVESLILSIIRHIDKKEFSIDLLIDEDSTIVPISEIESYGVKIIYIPPYQKIFKYLFKLKKVFSNGSYDIVHANISSLNVFPLMMAKLCGIQVRISHNHNLISPNAGRIKNLIKFLLSLFANIFPNYRIAPTEKAGQWLFRNKDFVIIKNGVENTKFIFNIEKRKEIRRDLDIDNETVLLGSFGRMISSKNIDLLLDVIQILSIYKQKFKLLLIGNGPEKVNLENKVLRSEELKQNVIFLNSKNNINNYYSALDIYLFPSTAEAFGMAAVESQINGLKTIVSRGVPHEAQVLSSLFMYKSDYKVDNWVKEIIDSPKYDQNERLALSRVAEVRAFSSAKMVSEFEEIYRNAKNTKQ